MKRLLILFFILIFNTLQSQVKVTGYVYDKTADVPIPGAIVIEENTENGTYTDKNGKFKITVKDSTAILRISYFVYKDVLIPVKNYKGEKIYLEENEGIVDIFLSHQVACGYYGDLDYLNYGIFLYHYNPYFYNISESLYFKTDLSSQYDFKIKIHKRGLFNFKKAWFLPYKLSASFFFQRRKWEDMEINDYKLYFKTPIFRIGTSIGLALKNDNRREQLDKGVYLGLSKYLRITKTSFKTTLTAYPDFTEYSFSAFQGFGDKKKFWRNLKIGLEYQKYRTYDEWNVFVMYYYTYFR